MATRFTQSGIVRFGGYYHTGFSAAQYGVGVSPGGYAALFRPQIFPISQLRSNNFSLAVTGLGTPNGAMVIIPPTSDYSITLRIKRV
jgi:uncharacterized ion transporter superfamily protein YfcC